MSDNQSKPVNIPVLRDVVVPVVASETRETSTIPAEQPLPASTLQDGIDTIIVQARADFETAIAHLQEEMQQRVERELNELHSQLTPDD
ncbi:MAG: hypothetical protein L3J89_05410 [Gammaproteobacteria bacterium]|nr:hypothetical protein [Gammaproteobacteria bacterium]